jgi:creatinine amidohydrolase
MRYGSCTYDEIARLAADGAVAVLPMGCTEPQGPHLPVDFDSWFADQLTERAAERARADHGVTAVVLPVIPVGPTPEHRSFGAGFLDLPRPLHDAVVTAILDSLATQGFETIVVWRGCGGHDLRQAVASFSTAWPGTRVHLPDPPFHQIWCAEADPAVPGGHADSFTTSIMLARRPSLVRLDRVPPLSRLPDWQDPDLDFGAYSDSGTIGDARHGSAELGERLWEAAVTWMSRYLAAITDRA